MADFVFLHGGAQGGWVWAETIAAIADHSGGTMRALALDVPGCGEKRHRATSALQMDDIARELAEEIVAANLSDVTLIGHSQAGCLIPRIIALIPQTIRKTVLIACAAPLPGQSLPAQMGRGLHGSNANEVGWPHDPTTTPPRDLFHTMFCNDMTADQAETFLARIGPDKWPDCASTETHWFYDHLVDHPLTYVTCLRDGILPIHWQESFAQRFHAKQVVGIGAGHQVMNTRPQELATLLIAEAADLGL